MARATFVIFASAGTWRLGAASATGLKLIDLPISPDAPADQAASIASTALKNAGYSGEGIMLAIPSSWCFSASVEVGDLPGHDRKAMLYRFEEKLPLAAEGVVADFVLRPGGEALGVCAKIETLRPLIDALESRQVAVQSIAPTVLLAAQSIPQESDQPGAVVLCPEDSQQINLVALERGVPVSWALAPANATDVELQLGLLSLSLSGTPALEALELDPILTSALGQPVKNHPGTVFSAAMTSATQVLLGRQRPSIELRRGPLAIRDPLRLVRKPLNAALAAGIALVLGVSAVLLIRAHRYADLEQSAQRQLVDAFREQFPAWEVPANVRVIVESEHRKSALAAGGAQPAHPSHSALQSFVDVMTRLPKEGRYSIGQLSFGESSFELQGQARTYEQLDGLAAAARQAGMQVQPPEARKNADGFWSFTLRGSTAQQGAAVAKGGP